MFCWGNTVNGELGLGGIEEEHILSPRELYFKEAANVSRVSCGENHTVMLTSSGSIFTCGSNDYGQLGHEGPHKRPEQVTALADQIITAVSSGGCHSLCVNEWGQIYSWGCNLHGQLGLESISSSQPTPRIVRTLATANIVQIASGIAHNLALANNGDLYSWGSNTYGQLGLGTTGGDISKPQIVNSLAGIPIAFIACGGFHSFAVSKSGAVFGWGKNTFGQLGLSDSSENKSFPSQLKTLRTVGVKYVACGDDFSVFLTKDGGVFTCGLGSYGQLGHNSRTNEVLPRKVMELMGMAVSQISCGRRHTIALVPENQRLYAFGIGGAGQLGNRLALNASSPQLVLGPWLPNNLEDTELLNHPVVPQPHSSPVLEKTIKNGRPFPVPVSSKCTLKSIFSGGDQCFLRVTDLKDSIAADDYREHDPMTQILAVTLERLKECEAVPADSTVDLDLISYIETAFSSQACINGSFLMPGNLHFSCSSRHHGIDMSLAQCCFATLARSENSSIIDLVFNCVIGALLQSLTKSPPDVETLRVYLVLPLYHGFENAKNYESLQCPFGQSVLVLATEASRIVDLWWISASADYFERLVRIFKNVLEYLINISSCDETRKEIPWNQNIVVGLETLRVLNGLNKKYPGGCKVPYETFYLQDLPDKVNLPFDYIRWLTEKSGNLAHSVSFCDYPFLFDARAKTLLLQTDQVMQMQSAVNEAASRAFSQMLLGGSMLSQMPFLILEVSRENIVRDTLIQLRILDSRDLKKPLKVKFLGEEAEDAGGVRKEFFLLLMREVLDPKYGMFQEYEETRAIWFSEDSFEDEGTYFLIGLMCGLAIYNYTIIELPFPLLLYKKLLGEPVSLEDLAHLSPTITRSLKSLLDYEGSDLQEVFSLYFEISREVFGDLKVIPLKPEGEKVPVTQENKKEYVDLYVDWVLNKSVQSHFQAYQSGFLKVCGGRVLKLFQAQELMAAVVGNEDYDWDELERGAEYKNGYTTSDKTIRLFWEVFHELSLEQKKKFLLFLTGSDRIPIMGMKAIKIVIQPTDDDRFLPVAHTCFDLLDLPRYATKEKLRYKLLQAIQQYQGFSLV